MLKLTLPRLSLHVKSRMSGRLKIQVGHAMWLVCLGQPTVLALFRQM
ncbi:Uncharacterised protein [Vibrio cholerae]|nr:Uncharacterised protein [Vibrio cholerae]